MQKNNTPSLHEIDAHPTKLIELTANYCRCMLRCVSADLVRVGELTKESTSLLSTAANLDYRNQVNTLLNPKTLVRRAELISASIPSLEQMCSEMDAALDAELEAQKFNKSVKHIAVNGKLLAEQNGYYLYVFSLNDPWEPEDETPVSINVNNIPSIKATVVTSTGTTITIATHDQLPQEALRQITLLNDSTQLLERLKEVLKNNDEGSSQLGSKAFGLLPFNSGKSPLPMDFGKFNPDDSQKQAILMACGSEVTYIVGPPGTGKTSTLAAIVFTHLRGGRSVLIAAHTNIAVDNAIMQLADICKNAGASNELPMDVLSGME